MTPKSVLWTVISTALAFIINFYVNYTMGMMSFWLVRSSGIKSVFSLVGVVFSGSLIPLVFFPQPLQIIQFFLPFQYITYVPAMVYTGSYTLAGISMSLPEIVGIQALAAFCVFILSKAVYARAIRQFTGVGA